jgi:uncharacterized membrane protein YraQ (UPF0718 family)/YHS domain-containing protein
MFWEVFWPLCLGFLLSAVIETAVPKRTVSRALGPNSAGRAALATGLGAASSSCSYAAVAVARSLFRKGASLRNAVIFEFASTNLVFELGLVLLILLGWSFVGAELLGGVVMVVLLTILFRFTLSQRLEAQARRQAEMGRRGKMEGHGAMDMSITDVLVWRRIFSPRAFTAISHYFYMSVASLWLDLLAGFLIAGALDAWVPQSFWTSLFYSGHGITSDIWSALLGPLVAMMSFVCSVGNVPLAAVLWRGGIGFGGAIAFIFGDLIIIPILNIYRKYYGGKTAAYLFLVSYATMVAAGLLMQLLFNALGWIPTNQSVTVIDSHPTWNYTTFLDVGFIALMLMLGARFLRTGGMAMLREMETPPEAQTGPVDPMCGMTVDPSTPYQLVRDGVTYYFCSAGCRDAFSRAPAGGEATVNH